MTSCEHSATAPCGLCELTAENDRLRERCEAYKGQVWAGSQEIERLRTALLRIIAADTHLQGVTAEDAIEVEGGFAEIAREALRPIEQSPPVTGKE